MFRAVKQFCVAVKVDTCHCMFIQTHRMYKAKSGH